MNGLTFGNPGLLWGVGLLAVPWLIHLWNRRRFQDEPWGAMRFLVAAHRRQARRVRLENILLLLIRIAAIAALIAAFADPRIAPSSSPPSRTRTRALHLFVVDGSYSMLASREGKTNWDRAAEAVDEIVGDARRGDGFSLLVMGRLPNRVVWQPSFARESFLTQVESTRAEHGTADVERATRAVEEWLRAVASSRFRFDIRIHWITDLESATWQPAAVDRLRQRWSKIARQATMVLHTLPRSDEPNCFVRRLIADRSIGIVGETVEAAVDVVNATSRARQVDVAFYDRGRLVDRSAVSLPPAGTASASVRIPVTQIEDLTIEARLPHDALAVDNHQFLVVPARRAVRVLCLEGGPGDGMPLELALDPEQTQRPFDVVRAGISRMWEFSLLEYDVVCLINAGPIEADAWKQLHAFVATGGGLIVAVGDRMAPGVWRDLPDAARPLLPGTVESLMGPGEFAPDPLGFRHPILDLFRGNERSGLLTMPVWTYLKVKPFDDASVALGIDTGDPLIVERRVGRGRAMWVLTAVEDRSRDPRTSPPAPWSAMSIWPSFVPLMQEVCRAATSGIKARRNVHVHEPLQGRLTPSEQRPSASLVLPDSERIRVPVVADEWGWKWSYDRVDRSGWYQLEWTTDLQRATTFAATIDPVESRLERTDIAMLTPYFVRPAEGRERPAGVAVRPFRLFRYLLAAGLALLLVEALVATALSREGGSV